MGQYTIELREIIERGLDIGLKNYPIWSEDYRETLNQKIIRHYKYKEIGFPTIGQFIDRLNMKMDEIMPYYVQLYKTTMYEYDPIHNADYTEEHTLTKDSEGNVVNKEIGTSEGTGTVTGTSSSESSSETSNDITNNHKQVSVDTPQSNVQEILDGSYEYASEVKNDFNQELGKTQNKGNASSEDKSTTNTSSTLTNDYESTSKHGEVETYKKHLKGNYGMTTSQAMIKAEREIILNIDMKIINDLRFLFMNVW